MTTPRQPDIKEIEVRDAVVSAGPLNHLVVVPLVSVAIEQAVGKGHVGFVNGDHADKQNRTKVLSLVQQTRNILLKVLKRRELTPTGSTDSAGIIDPNRQNNAVRDMMTQLTSTAKLCL